MSITDLTDNNQGLTTHTQKAAKANNSSPQNKVATQETMTAGTAAANSGLTAALGNVIFKTRKKVLENDDKIADERRAKMMLQRKSASQPSLSSASSKLLYGLSEYYDDDESSITETTDRDMTDHSMSSFDDGFEDGLSGDDLSSVEEGEEEDDEDGLVPSDTEGQGREAVSPKLGHKGGSYVLDSDDEDVDFANVLSAPVPKLDYESIPSIDDYADLVHSNKYIKLPSNWCVIVTDIVGSTKHIESGRYRDVNTVGVMTICAVRNALGVDQDFPYVFGGDGSSLVIQPQHEQLVLDTLLAVKRLVKANYKMDLRVGSVTIDELEDQGVTVEVTRYEIVAGMCIALFKGGGLALADAVIKGRPEYEQLQETSESLRITPNLDGLSCRWKKIPNRNGCVLTILVMDNPDIVYTDDSGDDSENSDSGGSDDEEETYNDSDMTMKMYQRVLEKLQQILKPETMKKANPINPELAEYKTASEMIADEQRMHENKASPSYINRAVEIGLCHVLFRWKKLQHAIIDAPEYVQGMRTHADHRKFDDMIRMVIDCTPDQADAIEQYLQGLYDDGRQVFFGVQRSQHTLMTCLLKDTNAGNHIHFVDGDLGGYAMAAKPLKMQLGSYAMAKRNRELKLLRQRQKQERLKKEQVQQQRRRERARRNEGSGRPGAVGTTKKKQRNRTM